MKILVTGGLGFIGSNFIKNTIQTTENQVINIDNQGIGSNQANLKKIENSNRYTFIKSNIREISNLKESLLEVEAIINFAAETHVDRSIRDPRPFIESNYIGTYEILETIRGNESIRLVQISTDEVYGDILKGSFTEQSALKPSNPYSATKAAADLLCLAYQRTYDLDIVITRCTNNFGPHQFPEKLIPKTIIRAINDLQVPIYGTGKNIRDWIYVQDHCEAIKTVMEKGKSGEIYNISSGNEKNVNEIVELILEHLQKPRSLINHVQDRPGHDIRYSLDSRKIRTQLGWKPKPNFNDSIYKTIDWYIDNQEWWKPLLNEEILAKTPWNK